MLWIAIITVLLLLFLLILKNCYLQELSYFPQVILLINGGDGIEKSIFFNDNQMSFRGWMRRVASWVSKL